MAVSLQTAKQLIGSRGVQPPEGIAPGTPQYDDWAMQWLQAAVNAGDPEAVRATGGTVSEGGGSDDLIADWSGAAPASAWYGQRKPTPAELRRYARDVGQSEDYDRFSDRQLADWISRKWDVSGGFFTNDFGDRVEKPTESGPKSSAAGYATGEMSVGRGGGGGGGGGKGKTPAETAPAAYQALEDPLQAALFNLAQSRGIQGQGGITDARSLQGGGIFTWGQQPQEAAPTTPAVPPTGNPALVPPAPTGERTAAVTPRSGTPRSGGSPAPFLTSPMLSQSPLASALGSSGNAWANWTAPKTTGGSAMSMPWSTPGTFSGPTSAFDQSLVNKFQGKSVNPQQWWMKQ